MSPVTHTGASSRSLVPGWADPRCGGQARAREGSPHGKWAKDRARNNRLLPSLLVHVFSAKDRNQKLLLSFRHIRCPHPPVSHSWLQTLSVRFTLYLVMGQGWHQTLYSSQESASCMRLVGKGTALQIRFLIKQYSLKRKAEKIKSKSTQSLLGKGKAKVWNPLQPKYTQSHSSKKAPCPTFIQPKQSCYTNKMLWARISKKELKFEGNSYKLVWERQQVWCTSAAYPGTNYIFYSKELLTKEARIPLLKDGIYLLSWSHTFSSPSVFRLYKHSTPPNPAACTARSFANRTKQNQICLQVLG